MEFKEGMVFRFKNNYYVLALICDGQYLMLSDDKDYGWELTESPNYEQIINSEAYKSYIPLSSGRQREFVTGWWYGERQLIATFTYVGDLEEVKHHFIVKHNMLDLYLRVKDDIGISFYGVTSVQKYNVGDKVKICDKKKMKDYIGDKDHDIIYDMFEYCNKEMTVRKVIYDSDYNDYFYLFEECYWKFHQDFLVDNNIDINFGGVESAQAGELLAEELIESFTKTFKDDTKQDKPKETMSLRTAMEYAESINDKVEEILQILKFLDEKGVQYSLTDDYFEVSVDNRHYTVTFKK